MSTDSASLVITCLRTISRGNVSKASVQIMMPIVNNLFEKVAIYLVGPITPVMEWRNRWI